MHQHQKSALGPESVLESVCPHVLGMYQLYLVWLYPVVLGAAFMYDRAKWVPWATEQVNALLTKFWSNGAVSKVAADWVFRADNSEAYFAIWFAALALPGLLLAVGRISLRWLLIVGATGALALGARFGSPLGDRTSPHFVNNIENLVLIGVGLAGTLATELYRRSHQYVVTDRRIIIRAGGRSSERSIFYGRIDDLVLSRPLLGSLFGFGSIIPVTSSGLGLGSDSAGGVILVGGNVGGARVSVGATGSRSENVVRPSLEQTLFNVPDPDRLYELIVGQVAQHA